MSTGKNLFLSIRNSLGFVTDAAMVEAKLLHYAMPQQISSSDPKDDACLPNIVRFARILLGAHPSDYGSFGLYHWSIGCSGELTFRFGGIVISFFYQLTTGAINSCL